MKKTASLFVAAAGLLTTLVLAACSRDSVATESRAASPEADKFNRETAESSRTPEEARDSAAAKARRQRGSEARP